MSRHNDCPGSSTEPAGTHRTPPRPRPPPPPRLLAARSQRGNYGRTPSPAIYRPLTTPYPKTCSELQIFMAAAAAAAAVSSGGRTRRELSARSARRPANGRAGPQPRRGASRDDVTARPGAPSRRSLARPIFRSELVPRPPEVTR